jgi:predicted nucleotidyltransferase
VLRVISEAQLTRIEAVLDRAGGLDALWVFGSEAAGRATERSDLDLAALFRSPPSFEALLTAREQIGDVFGRPVDLVDLERASPVLAMQVLRHGRLLAQHDASHRLRFVAALPGRYEDVQLLRRPAEKLLLARLAHGRA